MTYTEAKSLYAKIAGTFKSCIGLYNTIENAQSASLRGNKPQAIVLADSGFIVVCSYAAAEKLVAAGYQYA